MSEISFYTDNNTDCETYDSSDDYYDREYDKFHTNKILFLYNNLSDYEEINNDENCNNFQ